MTDITIPDGITSIGWGTFWATGLTNITIPNSVAMIEDAAFYNSENLKDVYYTGSKVQWESISIGLDNDNLANATIHYNSTGPDDPGPDNPPSPSGDITFRNDDNYLVHVGDKTILLASISGTAGLKESDIQWTSSNEAVAKITDSGALMGSSDATSVATIEGVSFGKATITVTLPDGRSNSCEITVKNAPDTVVITNSKSIELSPGTTYFIPVHSAESLHTKVKLKPIVPDAEIVWTSSDGDILSFDDAGTTTVRQPVAGHPIDDDSCIKDFVNVHARNTGKVKLTCSLSGISDAKCEINIVVFRDESKSFEKLNKNFNDKYNNYTKEVLSLLKKNKNQVSETTIDQQAEILMQQDKGNPKLVNFLDPRYAENAVAKKNIYMAVAQFLAESVQKYDLKNISVSDVDETQISVDIAKAVLDGLDTKEYTYKFGGTTVKIKGLTTNGAFLRRIHYKDAKTGGSFVWVAELVSTPKQVEQCIKAYIKELMLLEKNLVKEAYNQVKKEFVNLGFKGLEKMTKEKIKELIGPYADAFEKTGAGKVVTAVSVSLDYYNYLQNAIKLASDNPLALMNDLASMKNLSFEPKSIKDKTVNIAMKGLDEAKKKIDKAIDEFITTGTVDMDKIMNGWFDDTVSGIIAEIKCPVNITIYDANGTKLGYVGDDEIWYNEDIISVEKTGDLKTIYSHDKDLRFEMVGTDSGTVNCTFEEYSADVSVGRVNYYDIPICEGEVIYATVPSENISDETVDVFIGDESISADEYIASSDYSSSTATISCIAMPAAGGQTFGTGVFTRGDIVTLEASAEAGYEFVGWEDSTGELLSTDNSYTLTAKGNIELTALFQEYREPVLYKVTLDATGGTVSPSVLVTVFDGKLSSLPTPIYSGYTFNGWYTAIEGGEQIVEGAVFSQNTTLYAHWTREITPPTPDAYIVTFDPTGGIVTPDTATTNKDGRLTELPIPTYDGYTFNGWYTAADGGEAVTEETVFTSDTTVYAHWTKTTTPPVTYTVTFDPNSGTVTPATVTTDKDGKLTTLPIPTRDGYTFDGWYTAATDGTIVNIDTIYTADTTLYAHWTKAETPPDRPDAPDTNYISIPKTDNGEIISSTRYAAQGERVTLSAHPAAGYELESVTVTDVRGRTVTVRKVSDNRYTFTMPATRVEVAATFIKTEADTTPKDDELFTGLGTPGISGIVLNPAPLPFTDVQPQHWFYDNVDYVWKHYLMSGVSDTRFAPQLTTSRAMIWTILARMNNVRTDVNPGATWYERGMLWAMEQGVTDGTNPMGDITREQLAAMLWRNAGRPAPGDAADLTQFRDSNAVSGYAQTAVRWAVSVGILNGSNGEIDPQGTATRAQVAAMAARYGDRFA